MEPYHYSLSIHEDAERLDWSIKHDRIEHAISYMQSIKDMISKLEIILAERQ